MLAVFTRWLCGICHICGNYESTPNQFDAEAYNSLTDHQLKTLQDLCEKHEFHDQMTEPKMMELTEQVLNQLGDNIPLRMFLGHSESTNILYLATKNRYKNLVMLLLERGADITLLYCHNPVFDQRDLSIFFDCIFSKIFDERVKIRGKQETINMLLTLVSKNAQLKQIECVLSLLQFRFEFQADNSSKTNTGNQISLENQTRMMAKLVRLQLITAYTLEHPFIQVFVYCKYIRFRRLLQLSMLVQISWSFACAVFIFCNSHIQTSTNVENTSRTSNLTKLCDPILINDPTTLQLRFPVYLFLILFLLAVSLGKEILEFKSSWPNYRYYFRQLSNVAEWIVHFAIYIVLIMACVPRLMGIEDGVEYTKRMEQNHRRLWLWVLLGIYMSGIFTSLLLIQGQLTKTKSLGQYVAMFTSGLKNIIKFILAFFPFLLGFLIVFHILQPTRKQFLPSWGLGFAKLLAMMTGEIEYGAMFYGADEGQVAFKNILKLTMIIFTITVVILLQNLLVGMSVSDVQKLEEEARVSYLRGILENIYLMECGLVSVYPWLQKLLSALSFPNDWLIRRLTVFPEDLVIRDGDENNKRGMDRRYDEFPFELRKALMTWAINNVDKIIVDDSD